MSEKKIICIWCDSLFALYSAFPVIQKYRSTRQVYLYTNAANVQIAKDYTGLQTIISIQSIDNKMLTIIHHLFERTLVSSHFSPLYERLRKNDGFLEWLGKKIPFKLSKKNINSFYEKIFCSFPHKLMSDKLICFSRVSRPYLISNRGIRKILVMESWDHPTKAPFFMRPNCVLTWNKALKRDIIEFQNTKRVSYLYPLKFRYIKERKGYNDLELYESIRQNSYKEELDLIRNNDVVLYICTTSSMSKGYEGEVMFIDSIIKACKKINKIVYVKPKPNGPAGDYDRFKKENNVIVGIDSSNPNSIDMLDEDYHTFRYLMLKYSKVILNVGTTFVLEAALLKKPIIQFIVKQKKFGLFGEYSENIHIKLYLNNDKAIAYKDDINYIANLIENYSDNGYSEYIRNWLLLK